MGTHTGWDIPVCDNWMLHQILMYAKDEGDRAWCSNNVDRLLLRKTLEY